MASVRQTARILNQSLKGARSSARTRSWNHIQRKAYASSGDHGHQKAGGDLPWAITSVAITLPCIWYLWPPSKKSHEHAHEHAHEHEHGHEHDDQISHKDDEESSDGADNVENTESTDAAQEEIADKQVETESVKSDDSDNQEGKQETPDTSDDESGTILHEKEGGNKAQGVRFKGPTKNGPPGDTRKHIPDAKGANKKRIYSDYGERQGVAEGDDATVQEPGNVIDKPSASKYPGSMTIQSGKQEGVSNADTKHSTDIAGDPEKSQKPGSDPETAKSKGTIDPKQ